MFLTIPGFQNNVSNVCMVAHSEKECLFGVWCGSQWHISVLELVVFTGSTYLQYETSRISFGIFKCGAFRCWFNLFVNLICTTCMHSCGMWHAHTPLLSRPAGPAFCSFSFKTYDRQRVVSDFISSENKPCKDDIWSFVVGTKLFKIYSIYKQPSYYKQQSYSQHRVDSIFKNRVTEITSLKFISYASVFYRLLLCSWFSPIFRRHF